MQSKRDGPKDNVVWLTRPTLNASLHRKELVRRQLAKSLEWLDHMIKIDKMINHEAHSYAMSEDELRQQVYPILIEQGKMPRIA
jgi:hypothetical protein